MNERIKQVRKALKMTQGDFGKGLKMSNNYIYLIESGSKPVTESFIFSLCTVYKVNRNWLETGEGEMFDTSSTDAEIAELATEFFKDHNMNENEKRALLYFISIVSKMDTEQLKALLSVAKEFAEKKDAN